MFLHSSLQNKKYKIFAPSLIEIREPLTMDDIKEILLMENLIRIQFYIPKDTSIELFDETLKLLNEYLFKIKPNITLRVYSNAEGTFKNLSFLEKLSNVKHFSVDEWLLEDLLPITYLKKLESLSIGQTKSNKMSYQSLSSLTNLRSLSINGTKKNMDAISYITGLEGLTLNSVNLDSLEILLPLSNLKKLSINLGGIKNFEYLPQIGKIQVLELSWIRNLSESNLSSIAEMQYLKELKLKHLPNIASLLWLANTKKLQVLELENLKGLESLIGIEKIKNLEKLVLKTVTKDKSVDPIIKIVNLKELSIPYAWGKSNILKIHQKYPHLKLNESIEKIEFLLKKSKH